MARCLTIAKCVLTVVLAGFHTFRPDGDQPPQKDELTQKAPEQGSYSTDYRRDDLPPRRLMLTPRSVDQASIDSGELRLNILANLSRHR